MTKSAIAVPGFNDGQVNTVKIDGSFKGEGGYDSLVNVFKETLTT